MNPNNALIIIDMQIGFHDLTYWGSRNNPSLEKNIAHLLQCYREKKRPIIHIQHLSTEDKSPLRPDQEGVNFMPEINPLSGETIFQKNVNSAFIGTTLENYLHQNQIKNLTIVGLTTDHCVSTTTRMAANLGFQVTLIDDCLATFDKEYNGEFFSADLVHKISLASLSKEFARVFKTHQDYINEHLID